MPKLSLTKPLLILVYGFPGGGKTNLARQLAENLGLAHVQGDRVRFELFESPRYDKRENDVVNHLVDYFAEEFLNAGVSVVYDGDALRLTRRRALRDLSRKTKTNSIIVWLQIDLDSAFARAKNRDRRKPDDRFAQLFDKVSFESYINDMQNPNNEDYIVVSGKHNFRSQRSAVMKKLYEFGLIDSTAITAQVVKPELVNLVPRLRSGRVDQSRRNIFIR